MGYRNLTIRGKRDGFGCQLNAVLSGLAFCYNHPNYRYVHTPFCSVSHGWRENTDELNNLIGIPDGRHGKRIHVVYRYMAQVFKDPNHFYNTKTLDYIRQFYWSTPKPEPVKEDIVVHIRRGDVQRHRGGDRARRYIPNAWYNATIPQLAKRYPDHYTIAVHSEGEMDEFKPIMDGWPEDLIQRTKWKLSKGTGVPEVGHVGAHDQEYILPVTFHEMVTAKVLLQSKSGLSYTASLYSEGDIFFLSSGANGQQTGLSHWKMARHELEPKEPIFK
tara:strand:+ start:4199 stop:5020 length:822 start_codon:yes stop_codon:yes gene_type:complete